MQNQSEGQMSKQITLESFVKDECSHLFPDECYGSFSGKCLNGDVNGGRLKRESQTAVIHQYPYKFVYPNAGKCWVREGIPCDYFERHVLPIAERKKAYSEIVEEYREWCRSIEMHEPRFCKCGNEIDSNKRKCAACKEKVRRLRNKRYRAV